MLSPWILREPVLTFGFPIYLLAVLVLPLHLGWTGWSLGAFGAYVAIATVLFLLADMVVRNAYYPNWASLVPQGGISLVVLGVPALVAFGIGSVAGPIDEALDERVCATQGAVEADTAVAESDDTFDVTPDCVSAP